MAKDISVPQIDDILGDSSSRFFGSIYRTARQDISTHFTSTDNLSWSIEGNASVTYKSHWGERHGQQRIPHLSTIDAVLMLAQIGRNFYDEAIRLGLCTQTEEIVIEHVILRAGPNPDEDLSNMPVSGKIHISGRTVHASARIGNMRVGADYRIKSTGKHKYNRTADTSIETPTLNLNNVVVVPDKGRASATIQTPEPVDSFSGESLIVANIIACSQITQALISSLDGISREKSNTLWMRKYEAHVTEEPNNSPLNTAVSIDKHKIVSVGEKSFSTFNVCGNGYSVNCEYSIAHALPSSGSKGA